MKPTTRFYSFTSIALHAQAILALGACPESCLAYVTRVAAERVPVTHKATVQDKRMHNARMRANRANARCARINQRRPSRVAKIKMRLEYVKQGIDPFSFEAYQRGVPVRGFYALARGDQTSLSARFPWNPLRPRLALKAAYKRDAIACGEAGNQWREVSPNQFACLTNQKGN